jgi:hypothetical protein
MLEPSIVSVREGPRFVPTSRKSGGMRSVQTQGCTVAMTVSAVLYISHARWVADNAFCTVLPLVDRCQLPPQGAKGLTRYFCKWTLSHCQATVLETISAVALMAAVAAVGGMLAAVGGHPSVVQIWSSYLVVKLVVTNTGSADTHPWRKCCPVIFAAQCT